MFECNVLWDRLIKTIFFEDSDLAAFEEGIMLFKLSVVGVGVGVYEPFKSRRMHTEASNGSENRVMPEINGSVVRFVRHKGSDGSTIGAGAKPFKEKCGEREDSVKNSDEILKEGVRRETPGSDTWAVDGTELLQFMGDLLCKSAAIKPFHEAHPELNGAVKNSSQGFILRDMGRVRLPSRGRVVFAVRGVDVAITQGGAMRASVL